MSGKIIFKTLAAAFLALSAISCAKDTPAKDKPVYGEGEGNLHISFSTAGTTKAGTAQEGDIIKTGRLWLIDADDNVMRFYSADNINVASGEATIKNIKRGVYTLCILANCKELDSYVTGKKIDEAFKRKLLPPISDGSAPTFTEETGMPCSAVIHQEITVGENYVEAHLQRCVGRISIRVRNNIGDSKIAIGAVGLSQNNPSTGYLFEPLDGSVPPTVTNLSFKELTGITTIAPYETKEVYNSYLYEIDASTAVNGITFDLLGGIYDKAVSDEAISIAYRTQYNFSNNLSTLGDVSGNKYLIRSVESSTRYVGCTESGVGTSEFTEDSELEYFKDTPNYLWEFEGNSASAKLKNVKTGEYLDDYINMTADKDKAQIFTITNNAGKFLFGYKWGSSTYYMIYNEKKPTYAKNNTGTSAQWYVRLLDESSINEPYFENAVREIPREARPIHYVDKYGAHNKLERIDRNEHITVTVNIFYNREMGEFKFEVEGWSEKDSETTFD